MTNAQTAPDTDPYAELDSIGAALSEAHALRRFVVLERMAEIGMALMAGLRRRVERRLAAEEAGEETAGEALNANDTALTFSRLTRAMRLTFALDARMREELRVREYGPPAAANDPGPTDAEQHRSAGPVALYEQIYESEDDHDKALGRICADLGVDPALVAGRRSRS